MSKKVYISPSDQVSNAYAWGNTNEHVQCQKIAEAEAAALRRSGVEVQVAALGSTMPALRPVQQLRCGRPQLRPHQRLQRQGHGHPAVLLRHPRQGV